MSDIKEAELPSGVVIEKIGCLIIVAMFKGDNTEATRTHILRSENPSAAGLSNKEKTDIFINLLKGQV